MEATSIQHMVVAHVNTQIMHNQTVKVITRAKIALDGFALIQLILGADLAIKSHDITSKEYSLLMRLVKISLAQKAELQGEVYYFREEIVLLRKWLEARILHCEMEREKETKDIPVVRKFNVDTYIGMKYLLLDLREIMCVEISDVAE